jgi:hypothetical protein
MHIKALVRAVMLFVAFSLASPRFASASPILSLDLLTQGQRIAVGDQFSLAVSIADITDLFAYQFAISFNPAAVAANGVFDGGFLTSGGGTSVFSSLALSVPYVVAFDNVLGRIEVIDSLRGPVPPGVGATGGGHLVRFAFTAQVAGPQGFAISDILLQDSSGRLIDAQVSTVPEPSTLLLVASGVALTARFRRARRRLNGVSTTDESLKHV